MSDKSIIKKFKNFAPVTEAELAKAIREVEKEEDAFWQEVANRELKSDQNK